ncbi:hypothetical protein C8A03DRAFT_40299 [Achaetomium macrosporum]|uniref:Uncharacterized protein n=1 Tax=Achaetomium macrosporum TaxID=79813 RepID=A0AAN7CHS9_9PEZI|nr:hypothetical protein C8A03DRAFT_40299 [Achaetomium macrosporum]
MRILQFFLDVVENSSTTFEQNLLGSRGIDTIDPENIEAVLSTNFSDYSLGLRAPTFRPLLGNGIFTQDGATWKHSRHLLPPHSHYDLAAVTALEELRESVTSAALALKSASTNHHFDIPQSVSSIFTDRESLLQELRQLFIPRPGIIRDEMQRRFIIYGMGGSGKTQFCCKFAQDNRDSFWGVFWIDASTRERAKQTLGSIAEIAGLEKNENSALHWLSNLEHSYFPKGNRGNILVTTRNPACKVHGNVGPRYYDFRGLDLVEATLLLLKASDKPAPWDPACSAVYTTTWTTTADPGEEFAMRGSPRTARRQSQQFSLRGKSVTNAWRKKGTEVAADALELLDVLAFVHWETISPTIFTRALRNPMREAKQEEAAPERQPTRSLWSLILSFLLKNRTPPLLPSILRDASLSGVEDAEDRIRLALKQLTHMSLIIRNDHNDTYSMHPVVHTWARERPRIRLAAQALWADITGRLLAASILLPPLGASAADNKFHISLLPHIEHVQTCGQFAADNISSARRCKPTESWLATFLPPLGPDRDKLVMYAKFSLIYAKCGHWESGQRLMKEVWDALHRYLGPEHKRTRQAAFFLSIIYWNMVRATDAASLQSSLLETCTKHLGASHIDTLRVMKKVLRQPPEHPDVLEAMDNMGLTVAKFWETRHFEEAFQLHSRAAAGMSRVHSPDHEQTLIAKEYLCRVAVLLGGSHIKSATDTMAEVLAIRRAKLGKEHPYMLLAMVNLAIVLGAAGELGTAEDLIRQGLPVADRNLGRDHIGTLFGRHTLACILAQRGRYAEAEELLVHVTDSQKRMGSHRGDYHPDRLGALIELARCCYMSGKLDRAIAICDEAIRGFDAINSRSRMVQLTTSGSISLDTFRPEHHDVSFPFILFRACEDVG